ncbi:MAG: hypothetical protein IKC54_04575 [Clostridia bacterium]|nr:hypothetical protein [Clostridia bacterium]
MKVLVTLGNRMNDDGTLSNAMLDRLGKTLEVEKDFDRIVVTGGIAYDKNVMKGLREACEWIAPMTVYPGEDELLALVQGGLRAINKVEDAKIYE